MEDRRPAASLSSSWTDPYVGLPFRPDGRDRSGLDCWGLVCLIYAEQFGIELPSYAGVYTEATIAALRVVAREYRSWSARWQKVDFPEPFDVILFRMGGLICHVGMIINRREMIHILSGIDSCIEQHQSIIWRDRTQGYYRWKG